MVDNRRHRQARGAGTTKLWECPRCGAKLVAKNLSHACGPYSIEKFLEGKSEIGRDLFTRFVALIEKCGPYNVAPAKTRVAFMAAVRFASVNRVGNDFIDVHFVFPQAIESRRFRKVERLGKLHVHHLRLHDRLDCDRELAGWLRQSNREYGRRAWLTTRQVTGAAKHRSSRRADES
jgi:ribosomal protein L32